MADDWLFHCIAIATVSAALFARSAKSSYYHSNSMLSVQRAIIWNIYTLVSYRLNCAKSTKLTKLCCLWWRQADSFDATTKKWSFNTTKGSANIV